MKTAIVYYSKHHGNTNSVSSIHDRMALTNMIMKRAKDYPESVPDFMKI